LGFFDDYPRFFETSDTLPVPNRLNNRYKALIERHSDVLEGASVLDLASHDGRWSFAAAKSGAARVVGLEGQQVLVDDAEKSFDFYGIAQSRYRFVCGDLFQTIKDLQPGSFDVVMCFGFFHMHNRHHEMLREVQRLSPKYLIMDVWVLPFTTDPVTYLIPHVVDPYGSARFAPEFNYPLAYREPADQPVSPRDGSAIKFLDKADGALREVMVIAQPSQTALEWLLAEAGFGDFDYFDWKNAPIDNWTDMADYNLGSRVSLLAKNLRVDH